MLPTMCAMLCLCDSAVEIRIQFQPLLLSTYQMMTIQWSCLPHIGFKWKTWSSLMLHSPVCIGKNYFC